MDTRQLIDHITKTLGEMPPVDKITLGEFVRWGKNQRFWAIINKDYKDTIYCVFGDWQDGIKHKWASKEKFFDDHRKNVKEIEEKIKESKVKRDSTVEGYIKEIVKELNKNEPASDNEYMNKKNMPKHQDIRDASHFKYNKKVYSQPENKMVSQNKIINPDNTIAVFMRNIDGEIVGVQFISRKKRFLNTSKITGSMFCYGELDKSNYFYVAEGIGTAGSVYTAIGKPVGVCVVCAFNCHNMINVVAKIRDKYPSSKIVLCQDNDDAGRENCQKIVSKFSNVVIKKPTSQMVNDFADISLEKAKKDLEINEDDFIDIRSLGMDAKRYVFYSTYKKEKTECPISITKAHILDIAPLEYWMTMYPNEKGTGMNLDQCQNFLRKIARKQGSLDETKLRGSGYFLQDDKKVDGPLYAHSAGDIFLESNRTRIHLKGQRIHRPKPIRKRQYDWLVENVQIVTAACQEFCWSKDDYGKILMGWLLSAPFCGSLPFRPHIWMTGDSSSGKSWILTNVVKPLLGENSAHLTGGTTEAGIRAKLRHDAIPIVIDEFESEDIQESKKRKYVLELLRQASSQTDATIVKSSSDGSARVYQICTSALLASVRSALTFEANRNRFISLTLESNRQRGQYFDEVVKKIPISKLSVIRKLNIDYMFFNYHKFYEIYTGWYQDLRGKLNEHLNRCYSVIGASLNLYGVDLSKTAIMGMVKNAMEMISSENESCLNHLVNNELKYRGKAEGTILELVERLLYPDIQHDMYGTQEAPHINKVLSNNGIMFNSLDCTLYIYHRHPKIVEIMSRYPDSNWIRTILKLKGASVADANTIPKNMNFLQLKDKCIKIEYFLQNYKKV